MGAYLEHRASNRFVELTVANDRVSRRWGQIGSPGQSAETTDTGSRSAHAYVQHKLLVLAKRGYLPGRQDHDLFKLIGESPDDDGARLVYGDWLLAENDPRGELVAIQARRKAEPNNRELLLHEQRLLDEHAGTLLGDWAKQTEIEWRLGFAERVVWRLPESAPWDASHSAGQLRRFLGHPTGRLVRRISFRYDQAGPLSRSDWVRPRFAGMCDQLLDAVRRHVHEYVDFPFVLDEVTVTPAWDVGARAERVTVPGANASFSFAVLAPTS